MTVGAVRPSLLGRRRERALEAIGSGAIAVLQGAPAPRSSRAFRQTNEFHYLAGLDVPHAYFVLEGSGRSTIYLPRADEPRSENEGRQFSADDAGDVRELTGVDAVEPRKSVV